MRSLRTGRRSVSCLVLALAAIGCDPGFPETPGGCRLVEFGDVIRLAEPPSLDVVIAVDSSPASAPFRAQIAAEAESIAARLIERSIIAEPVGGVPQVRVRVVGGDLGCAGTPGELGAPRTRPSSDAPARCAESYGSEQVWPTQNRAEIAEAVACLAWASDGCDTQRPLEAALQEAQRVSAEVRRPDDLLAVYVVTARDEGSGIPAGELRPIAASLSPWIELGIVAGIPTDLGVIDRDALAIVREDPRIATGEPGCALATGLEAPSAPHLLELVEAIAPAVDRFHAASICGGTRAEVLPGFDGTALTGVCLAGAPAIDPETGDAECTVVEIPPEDGPVPPPCAERPGRHPDALEVDDEGRETCEVVEVHDETTQGWWLGTFPIACMPDRPAMRFRVPFVPRAHLSVRCVRYVSHREACE